MIQTKLQNSLLPRFVRTWYFDDKKNCRYFVTLNFRHYFIFTQLNWFTVYNTRQKQKLWAPLFYSLSNYVMVFCCQWHDVGTKWFSPPNQQGNLVCTPKERLWHLMKLVHQPADALNEESVVLEPIPLNELQYQHSLCIWAPTTHVRIPALSYLKVVSSFTLSHYLWRSLGPFSLPCAQKWL